MSQLILKKLSYFSLLLVAILIAADYSYAAADTSTAVPSIASKDDDDDDDKPKGRKGGRGGRDSQDRDDRGDRGDRDGRRQQRESDRESRRQQERSDRNSRRQQRDSDNESRRQQQWSDGNARRQQAESDRNSRRQQRESDNESRRQQWESDRNSRRQQQLSDWNARQQRRSERRRDHDDDDDNRSSRRERNDRRVVYASPQGFWNNILNRQNVYRQDNRRYEREQRRYLNKQRRAERRYAREQQPVYNQNVYNNYPQQSYGEANDNDFGSDIFGGSGGGWKDLILRGVIASVLGGGNGGFDLGSIIPQQQYSRGSAAYSGNSPVYGGYGQGSVPYYTPAPINPDYDQPNYYGQSETDSAGIGGILGSLPIADIISQFAGDNEFVSQLVGSLVTQGYDQGYVTGQQARENGYDEAPYDDPYAYQNGSCGACSASIGDNRRYLSEGFGLGYRDALAGNTGYESQGNTDLVSVLLSNVLSGI